MDKNTLKVLSLVVIIIAAISFSVYSLLKSNNSSYSRAEIVNIVEEYIQENPQALINSLNNYQREEQLKQEEQAQAAVQDHIEALENDPQTPFIGNKDADVTIVEFFDYSCGYCKRAFSTLQKVMEENKDIKIVFKEYPILGPNSVLGTKAALAVHSIAPEKYIDFHSAAMKGRISGKASIQKIVTDLGLDWKRVESLMDSAEVNMQIEKNRELTAALDIRGTPAFVIGGQLFRGAIGYEQMNEAIKNAQ